MNGVLQGDLVVHAGGDPLYDRDAKGDVSKLLAPVVAGLRASGVTRIDGAIVLDEGAFQDPGPGPAWPSEKQRWQEFCALAGGFNANAGCLTAFVEVVVTRVLSKVFPSAPWVVQLQDVYVFGILILVLLFKPAGLFGSSAVEKV